MIKILSTIASCVLAIALIGCGGGSSTPAPTPTPTPTPANSVTPNSASVIIGGSQIFTSSLPGVTWSLTGPGSIDQTGKYLAPATFPGVGANTGTVTATGGGVSATATLAVVYANDHQTAQSGPIKLGTEGGNVNDVNTGTNGGCCVGTLGSLWSRNGQNFILSNNHVLARSDAVNATGEAINQPGPTLCFGLNKTVANVTQAAPLKPTAGSDPTGCRGSTAPFCGSAPQNVDAAIAAVVLGEVDSTGSILDFGAAGPTSIADAPPSATIFAGTVTPGQQVAKSGRTSALTCSTIQALSGDFFVDYDASCGGAKAFSATFNNQIVVNGASFIQAGDSGSLLVTANTAQPMGLLFASSDTAALANPINAVITALTGGTPAAAPQIVGGPDHSISCVPTQNVPAAQTGLGSASTLAPQQRQAAATTRDRYAQALMADRAVSSVETGASADSPGEGAVVITLQSTPAKPIPPVLDGVRTRVVYENAPPPLTETQLDTTILVKQAHRDAVMSSPGIQGIAVGRSDDNPAEPAILIYTIKGVAHAPIAPVIDGIRTKIINSSRIVAR